MPQWIPAKADYRGSIVSGNHQAERLKAIATAKSSGWSVARVTSSGYTIMRCACGEHQTTLKKTPSNPDHFRQKARWMAATCTTEVPS
jgi:hypothetical protein